MLREFINHHLVDRLKHRFVGTKLAQPFWEKLNEWSLRGMNIGNSGGLSDSGELWVLDNLCATSKNAAPKIVFDVGANVGDYASQALSRCPHVVLYCFEPSVETFELLSSKMAGQEKARLFNFGFGENEERVTLFSNGKGSGLASVYQRRLDHLNINMSPVEEVLLQTLDEFCARESVAHIDLLKIDVEGHELSVLKGARELIASNAIELIQFEFGGTDIDSRTFLQDFYYLLTPQYKICRLLKDGAVLVEAYHERFEIFGYSNFLAMSEKIYDSFTQSQRGRRQGTAGANGISVRS